MPRGKQRPGHVTDEQIINAYQETRSGQKVSAQLGIGLTTVLRALERNNIERTGLQEYRATMNRPKTEPYVGVYQGSHDEIIKWYHDGDSMRVIADRIGRSVSVVARIVRKEGIARPFQAVGAEHSNWSGGRVDAGQGYWRQWIAEDDPMCSMRDHHGYVKEHRLVLARKIGRPLLETETAHHINGDRGDNRPENIELRQGKHGKHVVMCCMDCGSHNIGHAPLNG